MTQFYFDAWTTDNGLPQNAVNAILQTRDGHLWLTTFDGLVRYDGVRFTVFNTANTKGIRSGRFTRLYEDGAGNLWAATENSGLTRYTDGVFRTYTTRDGLPNNYVRWMREEADGSLIMQVSEGFVRWKDEGFTPYSPEQEGLPDFGQPVTRGTVWHRYPDRWQRMTEGRVTRVIPAENLSPSDIKSVYEDRVGSLWVATADGSLRQFKGGQWTAYPVSDPQSQGFVQTICEDRQGNLWVGTAKGSLLRFRDGKATLYPLPEDFTGCHIGVVYADREGGLWVGTSSGLLRLREQIITPYTESDGLAANNVYPILEDSKGAIWIGSWSGLTKYENGVFIRQPAPEGRAFSQVTALYEDREGGLWVAFYGGEVWRYKGEQVTVFTPQDGRLSKTGIHAIYQDRAGNYWFGSRNGLIRYKDGATTRYTTDDGLTANEIRVIHEDREGTLWVGTMSGLTRYRGGVFSAFEEGDGHPGSQIRTIYEDSDGVLWVGTYDMGLMRWHNGRFTRYTTYDGLFSNGAFRILEDERGRFWISCNTGIYRVSKQELNDFADGKAVAVTSIPYGKRDGMRKAECNGGSQPAGIKARDGKLWFPTQEGVAVIDPERAPINTRPPSVMIEDVLLDGRLVSTGRAIRVEPGQERLEIHFTGLNFVMPEGIKFKYKLSGLDTEWVDASTRRVAYYSHIPPGEYAFTVVAANEDGVWNLQGASVRISVVPPFWRTQWFLSLALLGLLGTALLLYRHRITQLKKAHAAQEAFSRQLIASQEGERKRIAAELHDGLGQRLIVIKNLALMMLHRPADSEQARQQVEEISAETSQAIHEVKEISYNLRPHQLDQLGLTRAIEARIKRVGESSDVVFRTKLDKLDGLFTKEAETSLYRIVQEAVNNIIKHSGATEAQVVIARDEAGVHITIGDNGRGFSTDVAAAESRLPSFGLFGISERVRMLGGGHTINSAPGEGTTISIHIGVQNGHGKY
ncbi:MAG TPA: two-component regulator propeller domain-containing protein [Blastocatellia bacterium]|nr:two-component regulator propeller domain-containing protein [Blastocatellia bacterium]